MKPTVRILHNLARSGGTIVSRCLGCMDGVALLSEIHPTHGIFDPAQQARDWYGIDVPEGLGVVDTIAAIEAACRSRGLALVLRSWDHVDYMPSQWRSEEPPMRSTLPESLRDRFDLRRVAVVRDAEPTWDSMRQFIAEWDLPSREEFAEGCERFGEMAATMGSVRYEDFCREPSWTLCDLCRMLDLPYDDGWRDKWQAYRNVTGDVGQFGRMTIGR